LVARLLWEQEVAGSNPATLNKIKFFLLKFFYFKNKLHRFNYFEYY